MDKCTTGQLNHKKTWPYSVGQIDPQTYAFCNYGKTVCTQVNFSKSINYVLIVQFVVNGCSPNALHGPEPI